ncbi:hypothetical protein PGANDO_1675, partial [Porphyromonas gingivalis]
FTRCTLTSKTLYSL